MHALAALHIHPPVHAPPTCALLADYRVARSRPRAGALLLGDAFNMRHPLTGGGMTVALSDTRLLCEMLQPLASFQDALATARSTSEFYTKRKPLSATINTLANALYKVFCVTGSDAHEEMRQACFDYLALGGDCASGPVSLLSGLNPSPQLLVMHFFSVALFGVGRLLQPRPTLRCATRCAVAAAAAGRRASRRLTASGMHGRGRADGH